MDHKVVETGCVTRRAPGTSTSTVAGSRCAMTRSGEIVCTFMAQSELGTNDFKPMIARSHDQGSSWSEPEAIWPGLTERFSIFGSISRTPSGDLVFYGTRTRIDTVGERFWSDETQGLKQNELIWSLSANGGKSWSDFRAIPMPLSGSAEAPGAMCVTRSGRMICCYAPYRTFDPTLKVRTNCIVALWSENDGTSWQPSEMLTFPEPNASGAEAWVTELADGRLLGTSWHVLAEGDAPNAYALSHDSGTSWSPTLSTGILGQSTALAPLPDGGALFLYNQRKFGEIGVWMAIVEPSEADFGIRANRIVWAAEQSSRTPGLTDHSNWTGFAFGEPSALLLSETEVLVTLWAARGNGGEIVYVKVRLM